MISLINLAFAIGILLSTSTIAGQLPLVTGPRITPEPHARLLSDLPSSEFTTLTHNSHPNYAMRIKRSSFCDATVNVYTGYLDISHKSHHLFFQFFESRNDPSNDDIIMWINGGPGCSSAIGLLMELGPCSIDTSPNGGKGNGTIWNAQSWSTRANVFFLDQPVGVGFSYADHGESISTTEDAAKDVQAFIALFFNSFTSFRGRPFHLSGESYAGRYLPVIAAEVYDHTKRAKVAGWLPDVHMESVIIGNGVTDFVSHHTSRHAIDCGTAALEKPPLDIASCVRAKSALPRCEKLLTEGCVDHFDSFDCAAAIGFCETELSRPFEALGLNVYDISKPCLEKPLCYKENGFIESYLNMPSTRALLGVDKAVQSFSACSDEVGDAFGSHLDKYSARTQEYVAALLDRGVKILIYAGTYDWRCNWVGNEKWSRELEWSGHEMFSKQPLRDWFLDGDNITAAGKTRSAKGFTFATIFGAGHMVPHDKPVEALTMLHRWLDGEEL